MNAPQKINGYPIIKSTFIPGKGGNRDGHTIIADRGPEEAGPRYVVAWAGIGDNQWCQGDYINDLAEASRQFDIRTNRYSR